jgi:hypothetical protein
MANLFQGKAKKEKIINPWLRHPLVPEASQPQGARLSAPCKDRMKNKCPSETGKTVASHTKQIQIYPSDNLTWQFSNHPS